MKRTVQSALWSTIMIWSAIMMTGCDSAKFLAVPSAPEGFKEVGGSNYVVFDVGEKYLSGGDHEAWFEHGMLEPVFGYYHLKDPKVIDEQLATMARNGQRKLGFMLWICPFENEDTKPGGVEGVMGHVLDSQSGAPLPQHAENIRGLLTQVRDSGYFNHIDFRFALQGDAIPSEWKDWNEAQYQQNWNYLVSVREIVEDVMRDSKMTLTYDLGAELAGHAVGQSMPYLTRFWREWTDAFGAEDSCAFSYALNHGQVTRMVEMYREVGVWPVAHHLDVYVNLPELLGGAIDEFRAAGVENPRIVIQETFYNDPQSLQEIQAVGREKGVEFDYLMQWQFARQSPASHFTVPYPADFDAYIR